VSRAQASASAFDPTTRTWAARWSRARVRVWSAREYLVAAAVIGALTLGFFNPIFRYHATFSDVAGHQTVIWPWAAQQNGYNDAYPQSDQADDFYPWEVFEQKTLRSGIFPLWNPFVFGGTPFLTNGGGGASYPPRAILALTVPASWNHDLFLLFHVFLSGLAMFFLMKELRVGFLGSILTAVAWTFSSFTFAWIQLEYAVLVAVCLPASLALAHRAVERRSWLAAAGAGLVLGISGLDTVFVTLLVFPIVLLYALALSLPGLARTRGLAGRARSLLEPAVVGVTTLAAGALVTIPTALMTSELGRNKLPYEVVRHEWAVPRSAFGLKHLVLARSEPISADLMHQMIFVGTPVALLALVGFFRRAPGSALGRWLAIGTLLVTTGTAALWIPYHLLPGFAYFRPLGRALFYWCFAVALLGGLGLDGLIRWSREPGLGSLEGKLPQGMRRNLSELRSRHGPTVLAAALIVGVGSVVWTADQLIKYGRKTNPPFQPRRSAYLYPETPAVKALLRDQNTRAETQPMRMLPIRRDPVGAQFTAPTMYASQGMVFGIESGAGYESLFPARISDVWRVVGGETPSHVFANKQLGAYFPSFFTQLTRFDLLPRLGVTTLYVPPDIDQDPYWKPGRYAPLRLRRVYSGPDGKVFDIRNAAPRAYVVFHAEYVGSRTKALERFASPSFPFRRMVLFEGRGPQGNAGPATPGPAAKLTHIDANAETYTVASDRPGWLVIGSMWSPGWHAEVNGHSTTVHRADYNLRAVAIPRGRSVVKLDYVPPGLFAGAALSATSLLAVPVILLGGALLRRRRAAR
jgi:Bacterial membrane protein YfhO